MASLATVLEEASDPSTAPERLAALARHRRLAVQRAVLQNPSAPPQVLGVLGFRFPRELLKSAGLALLASDQLRQVLFIAADRLLRLPELPERLLVVLAADPRLEVRERVARRRDLTAPVLAALAEGEGYGVACILAKHPSTPPQVLRRLAEAFPGDLVVLSDLVRQPSTPLDVVVDAALRWEYLRGELSPAALAQMAHDPRREVRLISATHPLTPAQALAEIVRGSLGPGEPGAPSWVLRARVAGNPGASPQLLASLACDPSARVRCEVAENAAASAELLTSLARDEDVSVRAAVARRSATPDAVLAELVRDPDYAVRHEVPEAALRRLARHTDPRVRAAVAAHDVAPPPLLERLARDQLAEVREAVASNPFMGGVLNEDRRAAIHRALARSARRARRPRAA